MKDIKILAVVSMDGGGKSTVVDYLAEKGYPKIRREEGEVLEIEHVLDEAHDLINAGQKRIVLDGISSWEEYTSLKHEFAGEVTCLAIVADKNLRHKRTETNKDDLGQSNPVAMADYYILNNDSIRDLHQRVDEILAEIDF